MYKSPYCYIADIETMTGKANRTAQRYMSEIRKHYGIQGRKKPTIEQVRAWLEEIK